MNKFIKKATQNNLDKLASMDGNCRKYVFRYVMRFPVEINFSMLGVKCKKIVRYTQGSINEFDTLSSIGGNY